MPARVDQIILIGIAHMKTAYSPWLSDRDVSSSRGQTRVTVWRHTRAGLLPPPVKLSPGCTRWPAHEVEAIDRARLAGADDTAIRELVLELTAARRQAVA